MMNGLLLLLDKHVVLGLIRLFLTTMLVTMALGNIFSRQLDTSFYVLMFILAVIIYVINFLEMYLHVRPRLHALQDVPMLTEVTQKPLDLARKTK